MNIVFITVIHRHYYNVFIILFKNERSIHGSNTLFSNNEWLAIDKIIFRW